jgi:hypothetical protein
MRYAIDQDGEPSGRVVLIKAEEGEDAVDVHEKRGLGGEHGKPLPRGR